MTPPLPARLVDRLRRLRDKARPATATPPAHETSSYSQWHGPSDGSAPTLSATLVADVILFQGTAPAEKALHLEFDGETPIESPLSHRFPHLDEPHGPRCCFETTIDSSTAPAAKRARLVVEGTPGAWVDLPGFPSSGNMEGVDELNSCPACRAARFTHVGRRQQLDMVCCNACGLVMTSPRPAEDHTLVRYSERYFENEYLPSQTLTRSLLRHIDSILDHAEPAKRASNRLFELGVGGGNLANRAAERGWSVSGTDVNPASVEHTGGGDVDVWLENSDHADSLRGSYGAVISEMSLEHVRRPDHFCALAAAALVPDGRLVIYTVSAEGASLEHSGMASPLVGPAEHLFLFSAGSLVSLCQSVGLRIDTIWRNPTGDEIGVVATKRRDVANPAVMSS